MSEAEQCADNSKKRPRRGPGALAAFQRATVVIAAMAVSAGLASLLLARRGGTAVETPRLRSVEVIEEAAPARQLLQDQD